VSKQTVSTSTDRVIDWAAEWQSGPLDSVYSVIFIVAVNLKVREGGVERLRSPSTDAFPQPKVKRHSQLHRILDTPVVTSVLVAIALRVVSTSQTLSNTSVAGQRAVSTRLRKSLRDAPLPGDVARDELLGGRVEWVYQPIDAPEVLNESCPLVR
jgi:hypothetical protein